MTHRELLFKTRDEYGAVKPDGLPTPLLLEPCSRNTAPSLAVSALWAECRHGPETVLLALPADHLIGDEAAFARAVASAVRLAETGLLVTFGIRPDAPETRYGYLEAEGQRVLRFVEKPPEALAREFVRSGRFLWNAGIFCMRTSVFLEELATHAPELLAAVRLDAESFARVPDGSIDHVLMEHSRQVAVVPADFGWSDVGSWSALASLTRPDSSGNRTLGQVRTVAGGDCYVQSPKRLATLVGVRDLIVVDTEDALLIAHRDRVDEVKAVVAGLQAQGHESALRHREIHRPWGSYTVLEEGPRFKIKRLVVRPRHALSLQMHHHRSEHWVVVSGTAEVENGGGNPCSRPTSQPTSRPAPATAWPIPGSSTWS